MRLSVIFFLLLPLVAFPQYSKFGTDTAGASTKSDNIYSRPLFHDSLCSSFFILIKKEVKAHKHLAHAEQVVVIEGKGSMKLGEKEFEIKKGDVIFIPKNTVHSVKTEVSPLKVISIQSPYFDGKDRVTVE